MLKTAPALLLEQTQESTRHAQPATILAPQPSFVMYQLTAQLLGLQFVGVPLQEDFQLDEAAMLQAIAQHRPELVFLAYPNNPTGTQWNAASMRRIIAAVAQYGGIAVVDEAYQPFASATWLDEIKAQPQANAHVVVMRTMSKLGLAGARLGYLFAQQTLAQEIDKVAGQGSIRPRTLDQDIPGGQAYPAHRRIHRHPDAADPRLGPGMEHRLARLHQ